MTESGWAVAWDMPTFADARDRVRRMGRLACLHQTLADAHFMAEQQMFDIDRYKAKVFWVVRET